MDRGRARCARPTSHHGIFLWYGTHLVALIPEKLASLFDPFPAKLASPRGKGLPFWWLGSWKQTQKGVSINKFCFTSQDKVAPRFRSRCLVVLVNNPPLWIADG